MPCTPEELAETRRRNARTHGTRGEPFLLMPDEGPDHVQGLCKLGAREQVLRTGRDVMQRCNVVSPTLFIQDEREGRLFFRDFSGSTSTFVRCFKELEATRERDVKAACGGVEADRR